jgi:hypothetical protein
MGKFKDLDIEEQNVRSRRGRTSLRRGNDFERWIAARIGGEAKRTGMFGTKTDVEAPWIAIQAKNGKSYPERIDGWLRSVSVRGDQLRAVVLGDAPGPGVKRRTLIVLDFEDFLSWYANGGEDVEIVVEE